MSQKGPTREECLQQVRDLEQRLMEAQAIIAELRSRLDAGAPAEVATAQADQQLIEELQTANEEMQSQTEELQVQAEELEMQNEELQRVSGELETERALLRTVLEQMPAGVIIAEAPSGRFLLANRQLAAILGRAVPMAKNLQEYDHYRGLNPDGRPFGLQDYPLAHCLTSGEKTLDEEINFIRADGSPGVIQVSATPVRNARGATIAGVATYQDITARKQAEREIRRLASFPQLNPNPVLELDAAGQITYYNQATLEALAAVEAADPKTFLPDDLPDILATARRTGQDNFHREVPVNGKVFLETVSFAESINVWRIYAVDVTERHRAEEALRQSNKRSADILESISDGFFSIDRDMVVTYFNSAAALILGRDRDEVLGQKLFDAFPEARGSIFEEKYAEALREGKPLLFEAFFELEPYHNWYEVRVFPFQDGISVYFQVTTERKKHEATLLRAKQDWERTFDAVPDLITIIDTDHQMIRVNRAMARALGREPQELIGRHCYEFMHESRGIPHVCPHQQLLADGREHTAELRELNRDFLVTTSPILNDDGTLFGSVHISRDITERKRAEAALKDSEESFRTMANAIPQLAWTAKSDGYIYWYNQRWYDYTGTTPEDMEGWGWQSVHDPEVLPQVLEQWRASIATGRPFDMVFPLRGADGQFRQFLTRVMSMKDADGQVIQWFGTNTDITERQRAEEALSQLNEELEQRVQERTAELRQTVEQLQSEVAERLEAEGALKSERQRFYDVLEMLPAYVVLLTPDYQVPFANRFFVERFGESQGKRCFEYLFGRTEPCEICETFKVLKTNAPQHWEWTGPDGRYYDIYDYPFTDVDGSPLIMEMGIDITERKQAEKQAENLGRLYRVMSRVNETIVRVPDRETLFQETCRIAVEDGMLRMAWVGLTDPAGRVIKPVAKYGYDAGYLDNLLITLKNGHECHGPTGTAVREGRYDLCNDFAAEPRMAPWREQALARGYLSSGAFPLRVGGEIVGALTLYAGTPGFFNNAEIALLEALADDLSFALESMDREVKQRQAEAKIRMASAYARSLIEVSLDPLVTISPAGKITDVNKATEWATGIPRDRLIGSDFSDYFTAPDKAREGYQQVLSQGFVRDYPLALRHASGPVMDVLYNAAIYKNEAGEVQGVFAAARDVTERKRAEEKIRRLNDELEQRVRERTAQLEAANREMEAFSYSVSHDLKAPIRAIDGFSKMLMAEHAAKLDPEALRLLEVVRHNTGHMGQLIDDLLALSRLGRREIKKTRLDLAAMSAAAFKEIQDADPGRRVELTVQDLPPACGDPSLLRQVLVNLLSNAFKFTKFREGAAIEVGGWRADGENVYYVKDNGVGFDMRYQEKLFGVFQRLHKQGEFEGTGVGLAIVQRILLRHGGRTWAEGQLGEGATFYFALPNREK